MIFNISNFSENELKNDDDLEMTHRSHQVLIFMTLFHKKTDVVWTEPK
jgi:hypothetical protein